MAGVLSALKTWLCSTRRLLRFFFAPLRGALEQGPVTPVVQAAAYMMSAAMAGLHGRWPGRTTLTVVAEENLVLSGIVGKGLVAGIERLELARTPEGQEVPGRGEPCNLSSEGIQLLKGMSRYGFFKKDLSRVHFTY